MIVKNNIQKILYEKELSFVKFAKDIGLSLHELQCLLSGELTIDKRLAEKVSLVLGVEINEIFER